MTKNLNSKCLNQSSFISFQILISTKLDGEVFTCTRVYTGEGINGGQGYHKGE